MHPSQRGDTDTGGCLLSRLLSGFPPFLPSATLILPESTISSRLCLELPPSSVLKQSLTASLSRWVLAPIRSACNLPHPIATGGEGGNNRLQVLERDAHPHLHQVLLLQHAQCRSLSRPGGQAGCGGEGAVHFQVKKGGSQDFVTQAGGEKSQPGVARRPNRELPEEKVLLLREGDVRGSLG